MPTEQDSRSSRGRGSPVAARTIGFDWRKALPSPSSADPSVDVPDMVAAALTSLPAADAAAGRGMIDVAGHTWATLRFARAGGSGSETIYLFGLRRTDGSGWRRSLLGELTVEFGTATAEVDDIGGETPGNWADGITPVDDSRGVPANPGFDVTPAGANDNVAREVTFDCNGVEHVEVMLPNGVQCMACGL